MKNRNEFAQVLASLGLSACDRAIAFLWFYRQTQQYDERTPGELALDLHDEGFPKPNVTRLARDLQRSRQTVRGKRAGTVQLDVRGLPTLDSTYLPALDLKVVAVSAAILPDESVSGTRVYIEKMAYQINASYAFGLYDACAVLCRRLMESLIIEIYISSGRTHEIQSGGVFMTLERVVAFVKNDRTVTLARGTGKIMDEVKQIGDTAAHDRTYITHQVDIDDLKARYRKLIAELLAVSGVRK